MQVDRILYPITSLGPGERLVILTIGCSKHCKNCTNPELWEGNPAKDINVTELVNMIKQTTQNHVIDGVTLTGGDPLEQITELNEMLPLLKDISDDVLIYTGYTLNEAKEALSQSEWENMSKYTSVLIDGPYIDELNDNKCVLRGSTNQNIIYFDETKRKLYSDYLSKERTVQNIYYNQKIISVGIHNRDL